MTKTQTDKQAAGISGTFQEEVFLALCLQLTAKTDAFLHLPPILKETETMWKANNLLTIEPHVL